ncbi:immunity protein Imm33 domain-containing protein [Sphingopyxis terrae]|uniref:immunity protein Imm33 domain-containing protein n=1 Tax=Sphingopyxis terrae TaxID=33052 RepID=UPI0010558092|nr:hypothetical protein [Sphingopyxis terrae]
MNQSEWLGSNLSSSIGTKIRGLSERICRRLFVRYSMFMEQVQLDICDRYGAAFSPPDGAMKVGISDSALRGEVPLHGLRHQAESGTSGWFIWSGEWSDAADFFKPLHLHHLTEECPAALPFLALPPGWRFMTAPGHEDVWSDDTLLAE